VNTLSLGDKPYNLLQLQKNNKYLKTFSLFELGPEFIWRTCWKFLVAYEIFIFPAVWYRFGTSSIPWEQSQWSSAHQRVPWWILRRGTECSPHIIAARSQFFASCVLRPLALSLWLCAPVGIWELTSKPRAEFFLHLRQHWAECCVITERSWVVHDSHWETPFGVHTFQNQLNNYMDAILVMKYSICRREYVCMYCIKRNKEN
jgi:hypothetical protein